MGNGCNEFLGFPQWYKYVLEPGTTTCEIKSDFSFIRDGVVSADFWLVGAAVLEILIRVAAIVAFIMIIYGGFRILSSSGNPDAVGQGRRSIANAIIGFAIAIMATTLVSYFAREFGSPGGLEPTDDPTSVLQFVTGLIYRIATAVTVLFIAISGFHFTTAGGDPQKVSRARSSIIAALIGLLITLFAMTIVAAVGGRL